jgi:ABC-2 type transport system permease protein
MNKLKVSLVKEILLLLSDKVGLLLMFVMPLLLVFIITVVQDSAFKLVNENKIEMLVVNKDQGNLGDSLIDKLAISGSFNIEVSNELDKTEIKKQTLNRDKLIAILIPINFTKKINQNSEKTSNLMLTEFGVIDSSMVQPKNQSFKNYNLDFYFDPILQENFRLSILSGINTVIVGIENRKMLQQLFSDMGYDKIPNHIQKELGQQNVSINSSPASNGSSVMVPNSSQHNVPAWSLFAMFFMVISLGGNIVKERLSGSFVRLQTIPIAFFLTIWSKVIVYIFVSLSQLTIMFCIGMFVFPYLGLPELKLPTNILALIVISVLSAYAAISYSMLIGVYAKTQDQAGGFGAISIIIFAAIGGIWVPSFIMPEYMQNIGMISPLHWCIEGYYSLFLKNGEWNELTGTLIYLLLFIFGCQFFTFIKLRKQNYI